MNLAFFRSELRSAVRAAQTETPEPDDIAPVEAPRQRPAQADLLRRVARGELSVDAALLALGDRHA